MDTDTTTEGVLRTVTAFVVETFPAASKELRPDESLLESGIVDSMGVLEIVLFLESEMQIEMNDEDMVGDNFETIQKITNFVLSKRGVPGT